MALRIRKGTLPYTLAEIIDCDYPEQWSKAQALYVAQHLFRLPPTGTLNFVWGFTIFAD